MPLQNRPNIYPKRKGHLKFIISHPNHWKKMSGCDFCCRRANLKDLTVMSQCGTCAAIASSERRAARSCLQIEVSTPSLRGDAKVKLDHFDPSKSGWKNSNQKYVKAPPRPEKKIWGKKSHGKVDIGIFFKLQTSKKKNTIRTKKITSQNPINCFFFRNPPPGLQWPATRGKQGYQCWSPWLEIWQPMTHQLFQRWVFWKSVGSLVKLSSHTFFGGSVWFDTHPPKQKKMGAFWWSLKLIWTLAKKLLGSREDAIVLYL